MRNNGIAANPELLFGARYAACFENTIHAIARTRKVKLTDTGINGLVDFRTDYGGSYEIVERLEVSLPELDQKKWPDH